MSRTTRLPVRIAAVSTATLLVLLGPAAGAWPAFADQAPVAPVNPAAGNEPQTPQNWEPPPYNPSTPLPPNVGPGGQPDGDYQLNSNAACIQSGVNTPIYRVPAAQSMLDIADAQKISTGKGVTVAVIDTGVNPHPFFGNRLEGGGDYIQSGGTGETDCDGHGTIVAGIIAADTRGSGLGFIGVAPDAKILAIRQTDGNFVNQATNEAAGDLKTLAEAIVFAASQPSVGVITMSLDNCNPLAQARAEETSADGLALQAALHYAVDEQDKVVVAAAGNIPNGNTADKNSQGGGNSSQSSSSGPCASVPQNDDPDGNAVKQVEIPPVYTNDVLSVASVDPNTGDPSVFTEWGPWVSVAAPGEGIISVDPGKGGTLLTDQTQQNGQVEQLQGTSFAAPYVAGLAALIRSKYPNMTARQVMYRIEATAQHPSGPGGRNNEVGYGVIDPVAALTALIPGQNGIPAAKASSINAEIPNSGSADGLPLQIAFIGTGVAAIILLVIYFVVRTNRQNRRRQRPQTGRA